jgi:hypothetical protein
VERSRANGQRSHSLWKFGSNYQPRDYPCRDTATGALRPVPPGTTRAETFCTHCPAERCILDRDRTPRPTRPGRTENNAAFRAECRRTGITTSGRPLARRCWNCVQLRRVMGLGLDLYICHWRHGDSPREVVVREARSRKTMLCRAPSEPVHGCGGTAFSLRLGPIEEWKIIHE